MVFEVGARLLRMRAGYFFGTATENCVQRSALLEQELRPGCVGLVQQAPVHINTLGMRGDELRRDGSTRVLALGDSCTFGWNVEGSESYPAVLERLLNRRAGTTRYQVLNAGVPGYTSYQGLVYLRERGLGLAPAIVVLGFGFNELVHLGDDETRLPRVGRLLPLLRTDDFFLAHSRLYRALRWKLDAAAPRDLGYRVTPEQYGRNLRTMVGLIRTHGARPLLLDFFRYPVADTPDRRFPETLATVAAELDVPLVRYEGPRFDVVHPTAEGYEILATRILDALEQAGDLRDGSPGT
jgi:lysophospholipase L1-like esterase